MVRGGRGPPGGTARGGTRSAAAVTQRTQALHTRHEVSAPSYSSWLRCYYRARYRIDRRYCIARLGSARLGSARLGSAQRE